MDYCIHDNNTKTCFYCKMNQRKEEKEKFREKNENNEILAFT